ncbi:MAG: hypothetical protein R8L53_06550 [Mariprofundales bacterium]
MEQNKFFIIISRINSVLILLVAIGAIISMAVVMGASNDWGNINTVRVKAGSDESENESIDLRLGSLEEMTGHNIQTINLLSDKKSRGLSSGYGGSQIRNVLFLSGENLESKWLYEKHSNLINCFCKLQASNKHNGEDPVLAVYISIIKDDTNNDGDLSDKDNVTLALARVDGSDYVEVDKRIANILDSTVTGGGGSVSFLLQIGSNIVVKKYSLSTFELVSERTISEISKKL